MKCIFVYLQVVISPKYVKILQMGTSIILSTLHLDFGQILAIILDIQLFLG